MTCGEGLSYTSRTTSGLIKVRLSSMNSLQQVPSSRTLLSQSTTNGVSTVASSTGHIGDFFCFTEVDGRGRAQVEPECDMMIVKGQGAQKQANSEKC